MPVETAEVKTRDNVEGGASSNIARRSSVLERVKARSKLLARWLKEGVPQDRIRSLPSSLREAAKWEDQANGIEPIPSPNDFTRTHPEWGTAVGRIDEMLREVRARYQVPRQKKSASAQAATSRAESEKLEALLQKVVSQWHVARDAAVRSKEALEYEKAIVLELTAQIAFKEAELIGKENEIAALRRELRSLKSVPRLHKP